MDRGLVTAWIHQSPISTPLNTHRYLVPPAWSGAACGASRTRTSVPTSITGQRSIKWPGSPQRQQAGPGFPATLVAGRGTRNWRGDTGGTGLVAALGLADPASLAWALKSSWALLSFHYMCGHIVGRDVVPHRTTVLHKYRYTTWSKTV